ncbi:hypothetical protein ZHAS_00020834 [Anopheles sinensis]|uniref:Uncharacterized protein n=1 Tax=Anopheles sinensis TaxID=74873 RepID=A0A084WQS2_ANOSI|nr:hypothetical protein ZHAS_00020834 [Anopheles sinensis]
MQTPAAWIPVLLAALSSRGFYDDIGSRARRNGIGISAHAAFCCSPRSVELAGAPLRRSRAAPQCDRDARDAETCVRVSVPNALCQKNTATLLCPT